MKPIEVLDHVLLEPKRWPCEGCPFERRNGDSHHSPERRSPRQVYQRRLKALLVRGALRHPWTVSFFLLGVAVGIMVGELITG